MNYASIGTVSHATLRTEDLLDAFASALEDLLKRNADQWTESDPTADICQETIDEARKVTDFQSEAAADLVDELIGHLDFFAKPYCRFGANEGDGADFGFWPSMESINELPQLTDGENDPPFADQAKARGEDCAFVNDHGNVTVYGADGAILLELV